MKEKGKKNQITPEILYRKNKKKAKIFKTMSPIMTLLFMLLAILFFVLTIQNSIGNVTEILQLLNKDSYNGEEIEKNYAYLVEKWGEWEIISEGSAGLIIRYVDVRNAMFSGLMITYSILTGISILLAILIGKIIFPQLSKIYNENNSEMVDVATLKSAAKIDEITQKKNSTKEWF